MIRLQNLSKYYVGNNEIALGLRKINLEFTIGELVAITGESGSGKSTLLNVLSGSDTYEEGEMFINGKPTSYFDDKDWEKYRRESISFIYQNYNLIDSYTVYENVNIALVIKGDVDDNSDKVMEYLGKVGLKEHAHKKATQLSSGQKQRLAIARALAKETEIIVADEPTGNLDSENSAEIIALLNELSKDKLVFVVTHNYDEIENYATRKIRMYDGEVAEDLTLRPKKISEGKIKQIEQREAKEEKVTDEKKDKKIISKMTSKIANLNRVSKPVTFVFLMTFMTVAALSFYILLGSFFSNLDNTTSKLFKTKNFTNDDITRIIIRNEDGSTFTKEDIEKISDVKYVEETEMYDCLGDIYYLTEEHKDYQYYYNYRLSEMDEPDYAKVYATDKSKFMKSATCITEEDLKAGRLPKDLYEIVVYSEDESIIGKEMKMFLGSELYWGTDLCEISFTVTGILEEETNQIYFSEQIGKMFGHKPGNYIKDTSIYDKVKENSEDAAMNILKPNTEYSLVIKGINLSPSQEPELVLDELEEGTDALEYVKAANKDLAKRPIFVVNKELTNDEAIVSGMFMSRAYVSDGSKGMIYPYALSNIVKLCVANASNESSLEKYLRLSEECLERAEWADSEESAEELRAQAEDYKNKYNEELEKTAPYKTILEIQPIFTNSTTNFVQISEEKFEELVGYKDSTQMAVYIRDYAYAEDVIDDLTELGYEVASVYRIGATEYDSELVSKKAVNMGISLGAFFMMFFIGIFIIGIIMNLRMRDFNILKLLGMDKDRLNLVNTKDIRTNMILATVIALVLIILLNFMKVEYIVNIVKYYKIRHYALYAVVITTFTYLLTVRSKSRIAKLTR